MNSVHMLLGIGSWWCWTEILYVVFEDCIFFSFFPHRHQQHRQGWCGESDSWLQRLASPIIEARAERCFSWSEKLTPISPHSTPAPLPYGACFSVFFNSRICWVLLFFLLLFFLLLGSFKRIPTFFILITFTPMLLPPCSPLFFGKLFHWLFLVAHGLI